MKYGQAGPNKILIANDQLRLQKYIRSHAINYLRENSFTLPQLPSFEIYEQLRSRREKNLMEEIQQQREMEKKIKLEKKKDNVSIDNSNGWIPAIKTDILDNIASNEDNEMVINQREALRVQIQLVEAYLNDAKKQNKFEESKILEQNLNELLETLASL